MGGGGKSVGIEVTDKPDRYELSELERAIKHESIRARVEP